MEQQRRLEMGTRNSRGCGAGVGAQDARAGACGRAEGVCVEAGDGAAAEVGDGPARRRRVDTVAERRRNRGRTEGDVFLLFLFF